MKLNTAKTFAALALALAASVSLAQQAAAPAGGGAHAAPVYKAKAKKLDRAEIDALLAKPEKLLIIDVRRPDELTSIGGFPAYLSIQAKELEGKTAFIPKDRTIITVSNHAGRAGAAADLLASKGFKIAGAVGVQDYEAQGGTLTKIAAPAPKVAEASAAAVQH